MPFYTLPEMSNLFRDLRHKGSVAGCRPGAVYRAEESSLLLCIDQISETTREVILGSEIRCPAT